ncbi:MAG: sugar transferase [Acidobacteriota bacterium]|nr:sugar transferase [Acidobacteriota bacterium]
MSRLKRRSSRTAVVVCGDVVLLAFSYVAAYYLRFGNLEGFKGKFPPAFQVVMVLGYLFIFYLFDLYSLGRDPLTAGSFLKVVLGIIAASVFISFLKYGLFLSPIGRGIFLIANGIFLFAAFAWRGVSYRVIRYLEKPKNVLIIGAGKPGRAIAQAIRESPRRYNLVGFLDDSFEPAAGGGHPEGGGILGRTDDLWRCLEAHGVDMIVLASPAGENFHMIDDIIKARLKGTAVSEMHDMYQLLRQRIPIDFVQDENWFLSFRGFEYEDKSWILKMKRFLDVGFSSLFLLLSLPLWPLIALLIKLNSKGPVFYRQLRVGKDESEFPVFKFRSMVRNAEEDEALWAAEDDHRITAVGKIIRKIHVDELPQFWNVIRGDMSLVGPRPERPSFVARLEKEIPFYSLRHLVKPGLTGWAQVNYPYAASLEDSRNKLEYDLYYIAHQNLLMDLLILLRTARKIFTGQQNPKTRETSDLSD